MFYITPNNNTCFDLEQILKFNYAVNEETGEIDETSIIIDFKTGLSMKLVCKSKEIAYFVFDDLCKYFGISKRINRKPRKHEG